MTRAARLVRGLAAAAALLAIVAGLPAALVVWGTSPVRGPLGWESLRDVLYELGSERVLVGVLTIAAWLVWALFLRALVAEIIELRRGRSESLLAAGYGQAPAAGPLRSLARRLVTSLTVTVGSMGPLAGVAGAMTAPPPALAAVLPAASAASTAWSPATEAVQPTPSAGESVPPTAPMVRVTLTEPSDAWNLAERLLGDGLRWKELWVHNRDRLQADGQRWTNPESTVRAGWELVVPASAHGQVLPASAAVDEATGPASATGEMTVAAGDSFWVLAQRRLSEVWGRPPTDDEITLYWREMVELNQGRLAPPGDPDVIYPGQVFVTPAVPLDATPLVVDAPAPPRPPAAEPPPPTSPPADSAPADEADPSAPAEAPGAGPVLPAPEGTSPPPTTTTAPETPPAPQGPDAEDAAANADDQTEADGTLPAAALAGGVVSAAVAVGVTRAIQRRRRRRNHRSPDTVPVEAGGDEELHRRLVLDADEGLIGLVCRCLDNLSAQVAAAGQACRPRVVQANGDHLDVLLDRATVPTVPGWQGEAEGSIWSAATQWWPPELSAVPAEDALMAAPLLVTLGCPDEGGQLYLDLETAGVVSLTGDLAAARAVARTLLVELAHSPFAANAQVISVGDLGSARLADLEGLRAVEDWAAAAADVEAWATQSAGALAANGWPNPFVGRGHDPDHDALIPLVVVAAEPPGEDILRAVQAAPTAAALVAVGDPVPGATVIECRREQLFLPQLGLTCRPQVLEPDDVEGVAQLLEVAETSSGQMAFGFRESTYQGRDGGDASYEAPSYEVLVRVLGEVTVEGGVSPLTGLQTALVSYIAVHRSVSADRIIDAIWPAAPSKAPRKRLSNAINKCRDALGARHLPAAADNHYSVGPGVATDLDLFERRVAAAAHMPPARAAETLGGALDLVRGAIFQYPGTDEHTYTWVSVENWISRWEPKIAAAGQRAAELYLELGDPARAVVEAERALQIVPHHSGLVEVLMLAHDAKGDRVAARRVFSEHAEALERLDLDTVAESTAALYKQLRSGSASG